MTTAPDADDTQELPPPEPLGGGWFVAGGFGDPAAPYILKPADRADCCSAQARVRVCFERWSDKLKVMLPTKFLDFCGHHYHRHELALIAAGWQVSCDTRGELLHRPGASA